MKRLDELTDLPQIDVHDPRYVEDPHAFVGKAREQSWIGKYNFGYMALDFQSMKDFLSDRRFRTGNRDLSKMMDIGDDTAFARFQNNFLQALNGPEHDRLRALVAPSFTPRAANLHRDYMRETINKVLDQNIPTGECDFVRVAARYPIT
jgi:cytochrome P450